MWLTLVVGLQVFVAPILAFTATYILKMDWDTYTFSLQVNLLPWIISAAVMYGLISLVLGLAVGGYMPNRVADAGGWRAVFRLTGRKRDADLVDRARFNLIQSPYGKVTRIVHQEVRVNGRPLLEVHGGLQLLAAPLQIVLIMLPLLVMRFVPGEWLQERRVLELALLVYLAGLVIGLRLYPKIASKVVGVAAIARRILVDRTKLGWLFPVLLLWIIERFIVDLAFQGLGLDYGRWDDIEVERGVLEAILPGQVDIPESSFLDLLVALSLLPMAIFTTMAVLGGGEQDPPRWFIGIEDEWQSLVEEPAALPAPGDTTDGTGTDVHEELESNEQDSEEDVGESFLFGDLAEQLDSLSDD
ncbi:MAG: hypothetical protein CND85_01840 [Marine Group II euryarchaeote MED-G33]|nr:MAG: hypothetical protein CND85_01840 [Marine Group II euryarchaeote MED-G33]|tara:strand:+ start:178 stop:1251 length:1074 start_codon:yes stop_codon:yes gene_type:complete